MLPTDGTVDAAEIVGSGRIATQPCYNEEAAIGKVVADFGRREFKLLAYLAQRAPAEERRRS